MTKRPPYDISERDRKGGFTADMFKNDLDTLESLMNNYWLQFDAARQEVCEPQRKLPVCAYKLTL